MKRRDVMSLLGGALLAGLLSGCTSFAPVYGDRSSASLADARFNFAPPANRLERIILDRLSVAFPNQAGPDDPVLRVSASSRSVASALSDAFAVGRPVNVRVEARIAIVQDGETLFAATRFADSAYQGGKLSPTNLASARGVEEQAAESAAEALRAAILAGYRPGLVSTQPR
ncbi:hypothetical protein O9Z70_13260 [Devosia sp. YIM 151766]|uniref:hypothetical protein n=1 Tax=Devosia sp. YIM 151766 TaxID=3017325 RepID=UPI00255C9B28|nr:hypothetical protein [Devosia sp. YIM 151766]WIY52418.1 hypothetical protein O9Z70_13260 [Devosia sp. YIM 151766]